MMINNNVTQKCCVLMIQKVKVALDQKKVKEKVKGTLHWVSKKGSVDIKVNEYDRLFEHSNPASSQKVNEELLKMINPNSSKTSIAKAEPFLSNAHKRRQVSISKKRVFHCRQQRNPFNCF